MKYSIFFIILFTSNTYANFPEMFGASSSTSGLANQFNDNENDPSNNYYAPALLSSSHRPQLQFSSNYNQSSFKEINNVTVRNSVNSESSNEIGNVDTAYPAFISNSVHLSLPILKETGNKFAVSIFTPGKNLQEMSSGDAFLPEYVMYRSRNSRTTVHFNFIFPWEDGWSYSLGAFSGLQISGETEIAARYNGSGKNSTAKMKAVAKPSLSPIFSVAKKHSLGTFILAYQHEMKNKMQIHAVGSTRDPALNFPYDFTMSSLLYFDPSTLRVGESWNVKNGKFFTTLEYQYWKSYSPSTISIEQNGGFIVGTGNYGNAKMRNIVIPKVGYEFNLNQNLIAQMGLAYRSTPLVGDFSGPGNAIDTDSQIYSLGLISRFTLLSKMTELSGCLQVHELKNKTVQKSAGNEDGGAGNKIGSPGYEIGGSILNLALGMKLEF
jgi:hypothetical protein